MTDNSNIKRKAEFYWASIGGANPEPVEKCLIDGRPAVYTLGCNDPFYLDGPDCPVVLGEINSIVVGGLGFLILDTDNPTPMERPATLEDSREKMEKAEKDYEKSGPHSWRGPR